jgi:amino acid adenylation domain-containing protein
MVNAPKLDRQNIEDILALSPMQEGMLFHYLQHPESGQYFEQLSLHLSGEIKPEIFKKAWDFVAGTNEMLRTVFRWEQVEKPIQIVLKKQALPFREYDFSMFESHIREIKLAEVSEKNHQERVDPAIAPFQVTFCKLGAYEWEMLIDYHHLIYDGWSNGIIIAELVDAYHEFVNGREPERPVKRKYKEYLKWRQKQDRQKQANYWKDYLSGFYAPTALPKHFRSNPGVNEARTYQYILTEALNRKIKEFVKERQITIATLFYVAWGLLLQRYANTEDVVFGTTVSGRAPEIQGIEAMVGLFINTIPLRMKADFTAHISGLLKQIELMLIARQDFETTPLVDIKSYSEISGSEPIFDTIVVIENYPLTGFLTKNNGSIKIDSYSAVEATNFALTLAVPAWERIQFNLIYDGGKFDAPFIINLTGHLINIIDTIITSPGLSPAEISMLSEREKQQLLSDFNATHTDYPKSQTIHQLFETQVRRAPDETALVCGAQLLSYTELNIRANRLARLLSNQGVAADTTIGIMAERSLEMVIGIIAILKSGGAYLPVDPEYPTARIQYMLEDSQTRILLTQSHLTGKINFPGKIIELDRSENFSGADSNLKNVNTPADLAYVMYTSGSTGNPKGVMVVHHNVVRLVLNTNYISFQKGDRILQTGAPVFDASTFEIWGALLNGLSLYLVKDEVILDAVKLAAELENNQITILWLTAPLFNQLAQHNPAMFATLKALLVGGDVLTPKHINRVREECPGLKIINGYGPTENTTFSACFPIDRYYEDNIPIGKPIANSSAYIVDRNNQLQPIGAPGELCVGGDGLAAGYLNKPDLTGERFVTNPFISGEKMYRTGDLARWLPDGNIEFLGRMDYQVKIRGYRIELGEIETQLLSYESVGAATVMVKEETAGNKYLVAYLAVERELESAAIKKWLSQRLPEYMIPRFFIQLKQMPLNVNGKIDRNALPEPEESITAATEYRAPRNTIEKDLVEIWEKILGRTKIGVNDNFFDLGGHSLHLIQIQNKLRTVLNREISIVQLFRYPTVHLMAQHLSNESTGPALVQPVSNRGKPRRRRAYRPEEAEIAIIGMSGRFPGAENIDEFWQNLRDGVESIQFFTDQELLAAGVPPALIQNPDYVKARGVLPDVELFDASFFGFNPKEAAVTDPQQRLFLECAWEAIETAGYDPETYPGAIGVFAGVTLNTYLLSFYTNRGLIESLGDYPVLIGNDKDFVSTRVSYKLNLTGPSVNIQTACSTSLTAVHFACQSLLNGECDMVLAGGSTVRIPQHSGYLYQKSGINSADGHCRAFDAKAGGTVGGNGVGVVVLKRLRDALADGDSIQAVIKGSAINNDGSLKVGFTAPSVEGQAAVIMEALEAAGIVPETIGYLEAHGTGTDLGDPIEIAALTQAFRNSTAAKGFCAVGSVKTNIGHLDAAAGVTGLIKAVLALKHHMIPASLHFEQPNPKIDFTNTPFYVNNKPREWNPADSHPRRAGVSSFGIGGTNAHIILEEAPVISSKTSTGFWRLLVFSAKTGSALEHITERMARYLKEQRDALDLADVAYTLQAGRTVFNHRRILVCRDREEAIQALETKESRRLFTSVAEPDDRFVAFMFPGQGAQYVNMAAGLYHTQTVFKEEIDRCAEFIKSILGVDLRDYLYPQAENDGFADQADDSALNQTWIAQPVLFMVEYALARLWMELGVQPKAMIGHSIGEYVAACLAGVFSLETALTLVCAWGRLMRDLPGGAIPAHAFHSKMLESILEKFIQQVDRVELKPPRLPFVSNVTGTWITAAEAMNPDYWGRHMRQTVNFAAGIQLLLREPDSILLEVGPGRTLSSLTMPFIPEAESPRVFSSLRDPVELEADEAFWLTTLGKLWLAGVKINWPELYSHQKPRRIPLPTYPFERQRYWIDIDQPGDKPKTTLAKKPEIEDWFYIPVWKEAPLTGQKPDIANHRRSWLVFPDEYGLGSRITNQLKKAQQDVIQVICGTDFKRIDPETFTVRPGQADDYIALIRELKRLKLKPDRIVHMGSVSPNNSEPSSFDSFADTQIKGFYSLLFLVQALEHQKFTGAVQLDVVTSNIHDVTGQEPLAPEKNTILGLCRTIPQEFSHFACRNLDLMVSNSENLLAQNLIDQLLTELYSGATEPVVVYRGHHRWIQTFEPVKLPDTGKLPPILRKDGIYLITGGLGEIGLTLAEYLVRTAGSKLVLTGRTVFPERENWDQWLEHHEDEDPTSIKIKRLKALEAIGAEFLIIRADVADYQEMRLAVDQGYARFGTINGVLHTAGITEGASFALIGEIRPADCELQFRPKVQGLFTLERIFHERKLDFWVLFSSAASVLGGLKFGAYAAANLFMDAYAYQARRFQSTPVISVNWDAWQPQTGAGANLKTKSCLAELALTPEEGVAALQRILEIPHFPQVIVSTGDLQLRLDHWVNRKANPSGTEARRAPALLHPRPDLQTDYIAPGNETEAAVARIWQEVLGLSQVGIYDNFFDLGGNSLLGIDLITKLRNELRIDLQLVSLYEGSTVRSIVNLIKPGQNEPDVLVQGQARGARRRNRLQERTGQITSGIG